MKIPQTGHRIAQIVEFSATDAAGPVRAALSSETPVSLPSLGVEEVLSHNSDAVDMSAVGSHGLPLTIGHSERDPHSQALPIGRVHNVHLEGRVLRGDLVFDSDEQGAAARGKVERGVAPDISLTYRRLDYDQTGEREITVTRWVPLAASLVTLPADPSVGVGRSLELDEGVSDVDTNEGTAPAPESKGIIADIEARKQAGYQDGAKAGRGEVAQIVSRALEVKRLRPDSASDVDELMAELIKQPDCTVSRFNELALDLIIPAGEPLAKPVDALPGRQPAAPLPVTSGQHGDDKAFRGMELAILERAVPTLIKPEEMQGNSYRGWTMLDIAREILVNHGVDTRGKSAEQIAKMAIGMRAISPGTAQYATADFPAMTENIGFKSMFDGFSRAERAWDKFCGTGSSPDFKAFTVPRLSHTQKLAIVAENAAYQPLTRVDQKEGGQVQKRGGLISYTWEAVVNNDINGFSDQMASSGEAAQATLDRDVITTLTLNQIAGASGPVMNDANQLFSSAHSNVTTAALSLAGVNALRVLMGRQADDNAEEISPRLSYIIVPLELEDTAIDLAGSEFLVDVGGAAQRANTVRNTFEVVSTHLLTDVTDYFGASRKGQHIDVYFLNGVQTPTLEQESGWDTDAIHYKVRFVYDVVVKDWRGLAWAEVAG